jgi:predicted transcriptional regulator
MKTADSLPDDLYRAADRVAERLRISRSELYRRALERYVAEQREQTVTDALNAVHGAGSERVDPELDAMQSGSLPREDWS